MTNLFRDDRYTRVAIGLHWLIAALILFNLGFGFFMEDFPKSVKMVILPLHFSAGVTVIALSLLRIAWRLTHRPPPLLPAPQWQHLSAHVAHFLLYALMLILPLTGLAIISSHPPGGPGAPMLWGVMPMPSLPVLPYLPPADQKAAHDNFVFLHMIFGWIMLILLVAHVAAALKHQFVDKAPQFRRIGIG